MKILLICDEKYHPGEVPIEGTAPLKTKGFEIDIIRDSSEFKIEMLKQYPLVIMSNCDQISPDNNESWKTSEIQQAFVDFVENGGGFLVTHSGTVAGKDTAVLDKLIGAKFSYHPNQTPMMVEPLKPHPVTKGVEAFCEDDEQYELEFLADDVDIFMASRRPSQGSLKKAADDAYHNSPSKLCACGYTRTQGKGRVCVLTPGHNIEVWLNPNFQRALENALNWCAQK